MEFLCKLIKIGRLSFGLNLDSCELYYAWVFPNFFESFHFSSLQDKKEFKIHHRDILIKSNLRHLYSTKMCIRNWVVWILRRQILNFTEHSIWNRWNNMALNRSTDELQESVILKLAKWSLPIPSRKGLLTIYGTNIIFTKSDLNFHLHLERIQSAPDWKHIFELSTSFITKTYLYDVLFKVSIST